MPSYDREKADKCVHSYELLRPVDAAHIPYPRVWIGTWSMGGEGFGPHDLSESVKTLEKAYQSGFRHFDTAGFYANGRSEELLAKVFGRVRKRIFISTKGGLWREGRRVWHDARPEALRQALFESLDRLRTDYLDLFQLHWPDPNVPLEESLGALEELKREGLVRFIGVGNLTGEAIRKFIKPGMLIPHQVHFNPICTKNVDSLKAGREGARCINCVTSPFEQGLLVNPVYLKKRLGKKDVRNRNPFFKDLALRNSLKNFFNGCVESDVSPAAVVLNWLLARDDIDIVIPGPRLPSQIYELLEGLKRLNSGIVNILCLKCPSL